MAKSASDIKAEVRKRASERMRVREDAAVAVSMAAASLDEAREQVLAAERALQESVDEALTVMDADELQELSGVAVGAMRRTRRPRGRKPASPDAAVGADAGHHDGGDGGAGA